MANSGVNVGFAKCFILFMAIVILVQGVIYLGLSIWGITQQTCSDQATSISENPFQYVLDLIYFINEKCGAPKTPEIANIPSEDMNITWAKSHEVTNRMYIFLIVYAVVSGLWIVASLLVIATICGPVTKMVSAICFWPWFLIVIGGSILDAVATGYHIHDIVWTTSAQKTFEYIGIAEPDTVVMQFLQSFDAYFITPAVIMTCVSSRVVLVWLLNIFGTSFCLSLSRVLADQNSHRSKHKSHTATTVTMTPALTAKPYQQEQIQVQPIEQRNIQTRPAALNLPPPVVTQSQYQRQQSNNRMPVQSPYSPNAPALTPDVIIVETARASESSPPMSPRAVIDDTTYRKTETHPDRLDYPTHAASSPASPPTAPSPVQLSSASLLNNRYSTPANQNPTSQRVSDELRSQLPWSYTSMLTKPQPPRKPQVYPEIPEPDYHAQPTTPGVVHDVGHGQSQQAYSRW